MPSLGVFLAIIILNGVLIISRIGENCVCSARITSTDDEIQTIHGCELKGGNFGLTVEGIMQALPFVGRGC